VIALVGVGLLAVAALLTAAARAFRGDRATSAARAPGVVVDVPVGLVDETTPSGSTSLFFPVVRFQAADGRTLEAPTREGSRPARAAVGDRVTVLYDPADPRRVDLEGRQPGGVATGLMTGLGVLVAAVGVALIVVGIA
jgi:Protein of unknown function (DUF3592)